ncbi:MAG: hypothetical protein AAGA81_01490 [Acidobacteriota bacterium]
MRAPSSPVLMFFLCFALLPAATLKPLISQESLESSTQGSGTPAAGNLAEIMKAFIYPASNLMFEVQRYDPGETPEAGSDAAESPLFKGTYGGWQAVEQAGVALVEIESVALRPRLCENGLDAPVDREDYREMSREMTEAARSILEAARARDREAVIERTDRLVVSCENCHLEYMRWDDRCTSS